MPVLKYKDGNEWKAIGSEGSSASGSDIKSFNFSSGIALTTEEIANLQYCVDNPTKVIFTIDNCLISGITWNHGDWYFQGIDKRNRTSNLSEFGITTLNNSTTITGSKIFSNHFEEIMTRNTVNNYLQSFSSWRDTQDQYDSNLYNAKELFVCIENLNGEKQTGYFVFGNGQTLGSNWQGNFFYLGYDSQSPYIYYDGSRLNYGNANNLNYFVYKT